MMTSSSQIDYYRSGTTIATASRFNQAATIHDEFSSESTRSHRPDSSPNIMKRLPKFRLLGLLSAFVFVAASQAKDLDLWFVPMSQDGPQKDR